MIKNYFNLDFNKNKINEYSNIVIFGRGRVASALIKQLSSMKNAHFIKPKTVSYVDFTKLKSEFGFSKIYKEELIKYINDNSKIKNSKTLIIFANMSGDKWKVNEDIIDDSQSSKFIIDTVANKINYSRANFDLLLISSIDCAMINDENYKPGIYAENRLNLETKFIETINDINNNTDFKVGSAIARLPMLAGIDKNWMHDFNELKLRPKAVSKGTFNNFNHIINWHSLNLATELDYSANAHDAFYGYNLGLYTIKYLDQYLNENMKAWEESGLHLNSHLAEDSNYVVLDLNSSSLADLIISGFEDKTIYTPYHYQTTIKEYLKYLIEKDEKYQKLEKLRFYPKSKAIDQSKYIDKIRYQQLLHRSDI